jgi:hypothetical protein
MPEKLAAESLPHPSSRKVAVDRNDPRSFTEGPEYDVTHGHPVTKTMPRQDYKPADLKPAVGQGQPKSDTAAPFTIKGA